MNRYDHSERKEGNEGNMDSDEGISDDDSYDDTDRYEDDHISYSVVDNKLSKTRQLILERKQLMIRSRSRHSHRSRRKKDKYNRYDHNGGGSSYHNTHGMSHGTGNQGNHSEIVDNLERNYRKYRVEMDCHESGALNVYGKKFGSI